MNRDEWVKNIYKEVNFCYSNCTHEGVNYTTNREVCNCKQTSATPHQEVERKANGNKVNQTLSHIGEKLYNETNHKVFSCYSNSLNVSSYMNNNIGFWFEESCLRIKHSL